MLLIVGGVVTGCGEADGPSTSGDPALLRPEARALRVSMAVRGLRPSPDELRTVAAAPDQLPALLDAWLDSDAFGATLRDLHAEQLLIRADTVDQLPSYGPLAGTPTWEVYEGTVEAPLRLIEHVVRSDRPYADILTTDEVLASAPLAAVYGLDYDPAGPEWQVTRWNDGRPTAGILSDSELWRRHRSAGSNFHRARANFVSELLLCETFAERNVPIEGGIDLSDELEVANAVRLNSTCVGCHQALDPLAAFFWGFRHQLKAKVVNEAYAADCHWDVYDDAPLPDGGVQEDLCYPLRTYIHALEDDWQDWDLRGPSYFGHPGERLDDLGRAIADDPRFATCTVRRFWSYLNQVPVHQPSDAWIQDRADRFVESGFDARQLVRDLVLDPKFLADDADLLLVRPEQLQRTIEDLTGFRWWADPDTVNLCGATCWGRVDLLVSDVYGFRTMAGGIDGLQVATPVHSPTPTRPLVMGRVAAEAAAWVVAHDADAPPHERLLLDPALTDPADVREQVADLHLRISGELVDPDGPVVARTVALWEAADAAAGDPGEAWLLTVAALLQDARMGFY